MKTKEEKLALLNEIQQEHGALGLYLICKEAGLDLKDILKDLEKDAPTSNTRPSSE